MRNKGVFGLALFLCCFLFISTPCRGEGNGIEEAESERGKVQIVLIETLTRFIVWPDESGMADLSKPFVLGFFGNYHSKFELDATIAKYNSKIKEKMVEVKIISSPDDPNIKNCHLLIISQKSGMYIEEILKVIGELPILTISDSPELAEKGVHIVFFKKKDGRWGFVLNAVEMKRARLKARHALLTYADKVILDSKKKKQ